MVCHKIYHPLDVNKGIREYMELKSFRKAELKTQISKSTIQRWFVKYGPTGIPKGDRYTKRSIRKIQTRKFEKMSHISCQLQSRNVVTIGQLAATFPMDRRPSKSCIHNILKCLKYRRMKIDRKQIYGNKASLDEKTKAFIENIKNIDLSRIISLDETGFMTHSHNNIYGYFIHRPDKEIIYNFRRQKASCAMAVTIQGILHQDTQPKSFSKSSFLQFLTKVVEKRNPCMDILLMDNIQFHHSVEVRDLATKHNMKIIYTPPYSPEFNPIEMYFANLKRNFRNFMYADAKFGDAVQASIMVTQHQHGDITPMFVRSLHVETTRASNRLI